MLPNRSASTCRARYAPVPASGASGTVAKPGTCTLLRRPRSADTCATTRVVGAGIQVLVSDGSQMTGRKKLRERVAARGSAANIASVSGPGIW